MKRLREYAGPLGMLLLFTAVGAALWLMKGNPFYLFNFGYIGASIALGLILYGKRVKRARSIVQLLVGSYMLLYLGVFHRENMQIEGFWYYLFSGTFEAAVIHYAVAKLFGPLVFGRGWCGYACWTAMVLDWLPWRRPAGARRKWGWMRYVLFAVSLLFVALLFALRAKNLERIMFVSFLTGNALYYAAGILLAFLLKDNRAFCKYLCPVTVFLKPAARFSAMRIRIDPEKCVSCGQCRKVCPMDVDMTDPSRSRLNGTECILCLECVEACPKKALKL